LKVAAINFKLGGDRLTFAPVRRQGLLQADLGKPERSDDRSAAVIIIIVVLVCSENSKMIGKPRQARNAKRCNTDGRANDDLSADHGALATWQLADPDHAHLSANPPLKNF
jgi:hypothetical protein